MWAFLHLQHGEKHFKTEMGKTAHILQYQAQEQQQKSIWERDEALILKFCPTTAVGSLHAALPWLKLGTKVLEDMLQPHYQGIVQEAAWSLNYSHESTEDTWKSVQQRVRLVLWDTTSKRHQSWFRGRAETEFLRKLGRAC